jgi:hypothetical protein
VKLAELERYFASVATSTSGPPTDLDDVFKSSARLPASELLAIYNRGYHYRLLGALESVFTRTKRALGEAEFDRLGLAYLARHPSEHPAIERVGRLFPEHLRTLGVSRPIVELCALEWARLQALVAPNARAIAATQTIDPKTFPESTLCFVPSLSTLSLTGDALALFVQTPATLPGSEAHGVAVWRKREVVRHEALAALEFSALTLARTGASVSQVCALFDSGAGSADAERAFRVVSGWFSREWLEEAEPGHPE